MRFYKKNIYYYGVRVQRKSNLQCNMLLLLLLSSPVSSDRIGSIINIITIIK